MGWCTIEHQHKAPHFLSVEICAFSLSDSVLKKLTCRASGATSPTPEQSDGSARRYAHAAGPASEDPFQCNAASERRHLNALASADQSPREGRDGQASREINHPPIMFSYFSMAQEVSGDPTHSRSLRSFAYFAFYLLRTNMDALTTI